MRPAAIAIAWFLSAAASAAAGEPAPAPATPALEAPTPAPNAPPYPGTAAAPPPPTFPGAPPPPATPSVPEGARAYAPTPAPANPAPAAPPAAQKGRVEPSRLGRAHACLGQAETRDKIAQRRLADPVGAMRAGRAEGEVLRTRLCRWKGDEFVYEIYVLRRDGHVVRLYTNAQNGDSVSAADVAEHR